MFHCANGRANADNFLGRRILGKRSIVIASMRESSVARSMSRCLLLVFVVLHTAPAFAEESLPAITPFRYNEDWSIVPDSPRRADGPQQELVVTFSRSVAIDSWPDALTRV